MQTRKYVGENIDEVMARVRTDFGPDAVILDTRFVRNRFLFIFKKRPRVEVIAGIGMNVRERTVAKPAEPERREGMSKLLAKKYGVPMAEPDTPVSTPTEASQNGAPPVAPTGLTIRQSPEHMDTAMADINEIKSMLGQLKNQIQNPDLKDTSDALFDQYMRLVRQKVSEDMAKAILRRIEEAIEPDQRNDATVIQDTIERTIRAMIPDPAPIQLRPPNTGPTVVTFIGPTGVGKTTTICKLAAKYGCLEHKKVGLITVDTYRIAAVEQIRRVAELVRIPVEVVEHDRDPVLVRTAIDKFKDYDLVLIDTAGRSQNDSEKMDELRNLLDTVAPDEVHLVLSLTAGNLQEVIEEFTRYRVDRLVLTKLDETNRYGLILDVLAQVKKSLSYITTGQTIPSDIEVAHPARISHLICETEVD